MLHSVLRFKRVHRQEEIYISSGLSNAIILSQVSVIHFPSFHHINIIDNRHKTSIGSTKRSLIIWQISINPCSSNCILQYCLWNYRFTAALDVRPLCRYISRDHSYVFLRTPHIYYEILAVFGSTDLKSTSLRLYVLCLIQICLQKSDPPLWCIF